MKTIFTVFGVLILLTISVAAQTAPSPQPSPAAKTDAPNAAPPPPSEQADRPPQPPRYKLLRSEEDWGFLRDKSKRNDYLDPIKYIRLREKREKNDDDWFLTLGGEIRPFYENFRNENFGQSVPDKNGYLLQRYMLYANLRLSRDFRAFVELKSGLITNRNGGARPPDKDKLDFNQAFAEFDFGFDKKNAENGKPPSPPKFAVRVGRQELDYGSGRLVSVREGPNVRQAFDGARIILNVEKFNIETFAVKPVDTKFGFFDDAINSQSSFWGVYAVRPFTVFHKLLPESSVDVYYFGVDRKLTRFDQGIGREIRHTFGARFWNKTQSFDYDLEFAGQTGKFGNGRIRAAFFSSNTGYTFKHNRLQPRIGLAAGFNSGDKSPNDPNLQTFSPPFPRGRYFGQIGANGPNNINGFSPSASLKIVNKITVTADSYFFFRNSLNDGVYGVPGNLIRSGRNSRARFIGVQPQIEGVWQIDQHLSFTANYARFFIGDFIKQTAPSRNVNYFASWVTYKF